jgi:hypothetical protein
MVRGEELEVFSRGGLEILLDSLVLPTDSKEELKKEEGTGTPAFCFILFRPESMCFTSANFLHQDSL